MKTLTNEITKWNDLNTDCRVWLNEVMDILDEECREENNSFIFSYVYEMIEESEFLDCNDKIEVNSYVSSVEFFNIVDTKDFN